MIIGLEDHPSGWSRRQPEDLPLEFVNKLLSHSRCPLIIEVGYENTGASSLG
jgi:hypothetical protein